MSVHDDFHPGRRPGAPEPGVSAKLLPEFETGIVDYANCPSASVAAISGSECSWSS